MKIEKLAALVPPPRVNLVRYHGVLAPAARRRPDVVPGSTAENPCRHTPVSNSRNSSASDHASPLLEAAGDARPRRYDWQELMRRVFEVDVLECPRCHGTMRILAQIHPPETTSAILECLGLPARAPPVTPPNVTEHAVTDAIPWIDDFDAPHPNDEF